MCKHTYSTGDSIVWIDAQINEKCEDKKKKWKMLTASRCEHSLSVMNDLVCLYKIRRSSLTWVATLCARLNAAAYGGLCQVSVGFCFCEFAKCHRDKFWRPSGDNGANWETKTMLWRIQSAHLKRPNERRDERKIWEDVKLWEFSLGQGGTQSPAYRKGNFIHIKL